MEHALEDCSRQGLLNWLGEQEQFAERLKASDREFGNPHLLVGAAATMTSVWIKRLAAAARRPTT